MTTSKLLKLAGNNLRRNYRALALSGVGIVVGIASLVFLVALGTATREHVLNRIFAVDHLEVGTRSYELGMFKLGGGPVTTKLDGEAVEELANIAGVEAVYPKMRFSFKAMGSAGEDFIGKDVYFELFADGIDPSLVSGDFPEGESPFQTRPDGEPIPILVSPQLIEFFNTSVANVFRLPKLSEDGLVGLRGHFHLGRSFAGRERGGKRPKRVPVEIVGLSSKALLLGATIPIDYVREFNSYFHGEDSADEFSSVILKVESPGRIPGVVKAVEDAGFELAPRSRDALRAGTLISVLMIIFSLISIIIIGIAAVSIAQTFITMVTERRRELGVLRAIGATRGDVRNLILVEAAAGGAAFGLAGILLGLLGCWTVDMGARHLLPAFPFKPDSFFEVHPVLIAGAFLLALLFSVVGALVPALRAARLDPAEALGPR